MWHQNHSKKWKTDKLDFIKIETFCVSEDTNKRVKRQPIEWDKIFSNHVLNKGIVFSIYKEILQFNN